MKLCICGIGGTGKRVASNFLENVDLDSSILSELTGAEYVSPGRISGAWIDLAGKDAEERSVFRILDDGPNERKYPRSVIASKAIENNSELHIKIQDKYGKRFDIHTQGTVRDAQFLKVIYEIFETDEEIQDLARKIGGGNKIIADNANLSEKKHGICKAPNPLFDAAWNLIKPYTVAGGEDCQGILFVVSFGGGTGTGFINPIIEHIRNEGNASFPVFVLGILTSSDDDQKTPVGQRFLSAISGLYDMLTMKNGANGIILMDEAILTKLCPNDQEHVKTNKYIHNAIRPMILERNYPETGTDSDLQAIQKFFSADSNGTRPIFVPFYHSQSRCKRANPEKDHYEEDLVRTAINKGKLFDCNPMKADKAMVFCRGYFFKDKIENAITECTGIKDSDNESRLWVNRKFGEKNDEILILLRNPFGEACPIGPDGKAHPVEGTLENKFCEIIDTALGYIEGKETREKVVDRANAGDILDKFFFGKDGTGQNDGFAFELREAKKRLHNGDKNFFRDPVPIFECGYKIKENIQSETYSLDEKKIISLVNKVVDERLGERGPIKPQ